jgi:hypothetical protein
MSGSSPSATTTAKQFSGPFSYKTLYEAYETATVGKKHPTEIHGNAKTVSRCIEYMFESASFPCKIRFQDAVFVINNGVVENMLVLKCTWEDDGLLHWVPSLDMEVTFT